MGGGYFILQFIFCSSKFFRFATYKESNLISKQSVRNRRNLFTNSQAQAGTAIAGATGIGAAIGSIGGPIGAGLGAALGFGVGKENIFTRKILRKWL